MSVQTILNLVSIPSTITSTATYTRIPASGQHPASLFSLPAPAPEAREASYRVAPGDNLTKIVRDHLLAQGRNPGNAEVYEGVNAVARANGLRNADLIHPGQTLNLSALNGSAPQGPAGASAAALPAERPPLRIPEARLTPPAPLLESAPLEDPAPVAAPSSSPTDVLLGTGLNQTATPIKISANLVKELLPADAPAAPRPELSHGAVGGSGPMPSDAAMALQKVLNRTANALSVLRGLVDHNPKSTGETEGPWTPILKGNARLSSEFGMRKDPFNSRMAFHDGIDIAVKRGTGVTALRDGVVSFSGFQGGYGNTVVLQHADGVETLYGHASKTHVTEGQTVKAGTVIADSGSTGRSTGPHLHFEVRRNGKPVNPMPYLENSNLKLAQNGH